MAKVTGIGGIFFKTDPAATAKWFTDVLDLPTDKWGRKFEWRDVERPDEKGSTVLGLFARDSDYFEKAFMLNLRVDDLDGMLEMLRGRGVEVIKVSDPDPFGRFAHVKGPDGLTLELWEPASPGPSEK